MHTSPKEIDLSPKILCLLKLSILDIISFLCTQASGLHGAIFQSSQVCRPSAGRRGKGEGKYEPCAAEETKHDGIVLRKGPAQASLAPWATCLFGEKEGRKEGSTHFEKSKPFHSVKI